MKRSVKITKNFFTNEELGLIKEESNNYFQGKEVLHNSKSWQPGLNSSGKDILVHYCQPGLDSEVWETVSKAVKKYFPEFSVKSINFHYIPPGSWINWHNDAHQVAAISVYLNTNWQTDWGGFFYYEMDKKFYIEYPSVNKAIFQKNGVGHATTPTSYGAPWRKSLQIWLKNE